METRHLLALVLLTGTTVVGLVTMVYFQRARDAALFLLVSLATITERLDVHFFSSEWYRGSTRGFEISLLDVLAFCLLASTWLYPRYGRSRWNWPASLGFMLLYLMYAGFSVVVSHPKLFGLFELSKIARGILIFMAAAAYLRTRREFIPLVSALAFAGCLEGFLAVKEHVMDGVYRVTGTLDHPNSLSMYLCVIGPVLVAAACSDFPRWLRWFSGIGIAGCTVAVMLAYSRAGVPIFTVVMLGAAAWSVSFRITIGKLVAVAVIALALGVLVAKSWNSLMNRYAEDTLAEEYLDETGTAENRGIYLRWAKAITHDHVLGIGLNNWSYWVGKVYGPRLGYPFEDYDEMKVYSLTKDSLPYFYLPAPAHNLIALTAGELGYPGLIVFGLLWLRWFQMGAAFLWRRRGDPMHRMGAGIFFGICGIFLQSMTEWTYRQTAIMFTFHILLGALAGLRQRRREALSDERAQELESEEPALELQEVLGVSQ